MNTLQYTAEQIKLKVIKLLAERDALIIRLSEAEKQNEVLKKQVETQKNTIAEAEEKNKIVKLAETLKESGGDIQELKRKLNEYISDIDECIRLLSER